MARSNAMREARHEVSRREIVQTAARLFAHRGVRSTSLAHIADELGITKAALYHYFGSKQDLVIEAVRQNERDFVSHVLSPLPADLEGPEQVLRAWIERKIAHVETHGALPLRFFYTVMLETLDDPEVERVYREFWGRTRPDSMKLIRHGQEAGLFRKDVDLDTALHVLTANVLGIDILWLNDPDRVNLRACYAFAVEQFLSSIRAPKPAAARTRKKKGRR